MLSEALAGLDGDGDDETTEMFRTVSGGEELVAGVQLLPGLAVEVDDVEEETAVPLVPTAWPEALSRLLSTATPSPNPPPKSPETERKRGETRWRRREGKGEGRG